MGPMGYGRGPMSLMGMVRGMGGGYGGMNPYQQMMGRQMAGTFGGMQGIQNMAASPAMQALRDRYAGQGPQGSSWEQPPAQGAFGPSGGNMQGAADANAQAMQAHQAAQAQKQQLMASGMSEEDAHRQAMQTYSSQMGPPPQAAPQQGAGWQGAMGQMGALQGNGPGTYTGAMQAGPQGWNWNAPSQGALQSRIGSILGGGGPMSLGALARMGMFRR